MKPNFALRLAHDSIELLQRSSDGWLSVGSARLEDAELGEAIERLRAHAERLAPDGIATKLIIPDTELRYETVPAPGPDDAARRRQIEAAIDGLTPYPLEDLVYDWVVEGDQALVVIAARETLAEAEDFAAAQGFNPVSFVAMPAGGQFLGEPFFGATRHAAATLPAKTRVLPDAEPVEVVGRARIPAAQTVPATGAARSAPAPSDTPPAPPPAASDAEETPQPAAKAEPPARDTPAAPRPEAGAQATPAAASPIPDPRKRTGVRLPSRDTSDGATSPARPGLLPSGLRRTGAAKAAAGTAAARASAGELLRRFRARLPGASAAAKATGERAQTPPAPRDAGRPPAEESAAAFASRRKPAVSDEKPGAVETSGTGAAARTRLAAILASGLPAAERARSTAARLGEGVRRKLRPAEKTAPATKAAAASPAPTGKAPVSAKPGAREPQAAASRSGAPFGRASTRTGPVEPIVPTSRPPSNEREKAREAEALTIFGARSGGARRGGAGSRRGLALGGGLVLLLVAVGAAAAYFAFAPERDVATPATTEPTTTAAAPADPVTAPPPVGEAEDAPTQETAAAEPPATDEAAPNATATPDADERMEALVDEALRPGEPAEQFPGPELASTREPADPGTGAPGEAAATPPERLALPGPLQRPAVDLPALINLPPPPPFGTEMQLGDDGLIVATPDGALTPDGITVFARQPDAVPPARPAITPPAPDALSEPEGVTDTAPGDDASAADAVETAPDDAAELRGFSLELEPTPGADPALADFRPVPRPTTTPDPEPEQPVAETPADDDEALNGPIDQAQDAPAPGAIALASLRPNPRPVSLDERGATAEPAPEPAPEVDLSSATPQAVARSMLPSARPQDFAATVQQALAAASRRQPEPARQEAAPSPPQQAAQPQPAQPQATQPQPQTQTAAAQPQIPTAASVAETATTRRAINLRRVNLIGVFGSQSNRRALVRMPNGQVVRVQVGDALDGGRVSAIGDGELRYVRGGRNQILRIGQSG